MILETQIEMANRWTQTARPIGDAIHALDAAIDDLYTITDAYQRECALRPLEKAKADLLSQLDGIRDNAYCDAAMCQPEYGAPDAVWDEYEAFNDALHSSVVSVAVFLKGCAA